jgi:hypothetical protein
LRCPPDVTALAGLIGVHIARRSHASAGPWSPESEGTTAPSTPHQRLRFVIIQDTPGVWFVRGLEHDMVVEGRTIGAAVREAINFVRAHTAFDMPHDLLPLKAFPPAPPNYWHAYGSGTPLSLTQLGITQPDGWEICAAVSHRRL